jgi:hypothetical protein
MNLEEVEEAIACFTPGLAQRVQHELTDLASQLNYLPDLPNLVDVPGSTDLPAKVMYYESLSRDDPISTKHALLTSSPDLVARTTGFERFVSRVRAECRRSPTVQSLTPRIAALDAELRAHEV